MTEYLYDTKDNHILGMNPCLMENYPTRFRVATEAEVDSHFEQIGKPRHPVDNVELHKAERAAEAEADAKEKLRAEAEYRANLAEKAEAAKPKPVVSEETKAKRVAALAHARELKKAKRETANEPG